MPITGRQAIRGLWTASAGLLPATVLAACSAAGSSAPAAIIRSSSGSLDASLDAVAAKYGSGMPRSPCKGRVVGSHLRYGFNVVRPVRIGSLSKSITGMAIALLIQDKKLTIRTALAEVLPHYLRAQHAKSGGRLLKPSLGPLDIAHLLAHRAGLRANSSSDRVNGLSSRTMLQFMPARPVLSDYLFMSGDERLNGTSGFRYSNLSFVFLGMVVEAASGLAYEDFCHERLLRPTGVSGRIPPDLR